MSEVIKSFVRNMNMEDEALSEPNRCRYSVLRLKSMVDANFPEAETIFLVYPEAREDTGVHYSLLVRDKGAEIVINLVQAPGFPEYIGDLKSAVPMFSAMKKTAKVI